MGIFVNSFPHISHEYENFARKSLCPLLKYFFAAVPGGTLGHIVWDAAAKVTHTIHIMETFEMLVCHAPSLCSPYVWGGDLLCRKNCNKVQRIIISLLPTHQDVPLTWEANYVGSLRPKKYSMEVGISFNKKQMFDFSPEEGITHRTAAGPNKRLWHE